MVKPGFQPRMHPRWLRGGMRRGTATTDKATIIWDDEVFRQFLKEFPISARFYLKVAMTESVKILEMTAIANCPRPGWQLPWGYKYSGYKPTGALRRSIRGRVYSWKTGVVEAGGASAPYAIFVHYGATVRSRSGGAIVIPPRPFLTVALYRHYEDIHKIFSDALHEARLHAAIAANRGKKIELE